MRLLFVVYAAVQIISAVTGSLANECRGLSTEVPCQCDDKGRCRKGTVEVQPWLQFALKTQRELQINFRVDQMQVFDAHNAFNNRAYGLAYGANDTCQWPPPYDNVCIGIANHEFSIVDMLNMGIRSVELDIWWCFDAMRVAHLGTRFALGCGEFNVPLADVIADIGDWLDQTENEDEFVRIYFNEGYDQGHDADVNGPLERYLGHDRILSPADLRDTYGGVWPTLRRMREDGKRVVVVADGDNVHQGKYLHTTRYQGFHADEFTNYPQCGGKNDTNRLRFYGDSTHYGFNIIYDGPSVAGVTTDLSEMVKCRITYPAVDMVTPQLMATAVFTWAPGEPSLDLDETTCVLLNNEDSRWYTPRDCGQSLSYACQSASNPEDWKISETTGSYDVTTNLCPIGYKFSVPHNGYRQQKLIEAMRGAPVWLNFSPWLTGSFPTTITPSTTTASTEGLHASGRYTIRASSGLIE
ncbi:uncharacterized protein [Diadema antillarum]|uniref:uncharacterized protein n=1 Tax=Diadema antillarum TaxID=105358 RepID=UPI003A8627F3